MEQHLHTFKFHIPFVLHLPCMKNILLLILTLFWLMPARCQLSNQVLQDFKKLDWLEGTWKRTNVKPGRSGSEYWLKQSDSAWLGTGVSMKDADTVFVEKIKLMIKDGSIYYVADIPENKEPVYFKLTDITTNGFICENSGHDFPQKIVYQLLDVNRLKAIVSSTNRSIEYLFEKE